MIYILTIHWGSDRWIDIQWRFIHAHIVGEKKIFVSLSPDLAIYASRYDYALISSDPSHAGKLNKLAAKACLETSDDDILIFLDGDAFPVQPIDLFLSATLEAFPLAALQRRENYDIQPHPSFCFTKASFWNSLQGDWSRGIWINANGDAINDIGGKLLSSLNTIGVEWYKMKRTSSHKIHPVFFGVYENVVYHHGAGFREPLSRFDLYSLDLSARSRKLAFYLKMHNLGIKFWNHLSRVIDRNEKWSKEIYHAIKGDEEYIMENLN